MTTEQPQPSPMPVTRRWRVTMSDQTVRTIEAHGFRVEGGALVLVLPLGNAAAYSPGSWHSIEAFQQLGISPNDIPNFASLERNALS